MNDLSEFFSRKEFACKCGCGFDDISLSLVRNLTSLREILDEPIHILSGCRCSKHNKECGGVEHSQHLRGLAADIYITGLMPRQLAHFIETGTHLVFGGIGIYSTFLHVDMRQGFSRWRG